MGRSKKKRNEYALHQLEDLHYCSEMKFNIIAIVIEAGLPKFTKGTDQCCNIRLIDETRYETSMSVNLFSDTAQSLPHVPPGDIILLRNVTSKRHDQEVNAVFYKDSSTFALYKGKDTALDDFDPYQLFSTNIFLTQLDKIRIVNLRRWLPNFQIPKEPFTFSMLREIKEGYLNLACKILHCSESTKDNWFLYVWDGTDTPPNVLYTMPEDEINSTRTLHPEPMPLPRDILRTFPTVGSILRITFEQPIEEDHLRVLNIDKWVKFVNIRLKVYAGLWYGIFTSQSKIRYTSNVDHQIIERQRLYDERISLKSGTIAIGSLPQSESLRITKVNHDHVPQCTLMDVLTHSEVTAKFTCVVRVVAAKPWQAEKLCSPTSQYMTRLTLEDPTARIHAFVIGEDGETLFDGYPGIANMKRKLDRLLGVTECGDGIVVKETPRNPPWVIVCIKSYYTSKTDVWGSRTFGIFDTKIVGEP
ncbi:putative protection of telomeres protein [Medicago truncatula]|uniref:Protection of telomeres 1a protein n=1 Tax=Medicago truncatula TaxID=3880 RepID=G7LE70_MEDTR|nr:protection of telomeres protein 1b [Medicago truncatula]AET05602.1 protection of telomeres 1a protein [Medicago truncatula]RHN43928.1 putative protection of telomeres protein [Medicago truncatula]